jgi:hypothetical protein
VADQQIGALEQAIRRRAQMQAQTEFQRHRQELLRLGGSGTTTKFTYDDKEALSKMLDKFYHGLVLPHFEDKALRDFRSSYERLITEYPEMAAQNMPS